ncbi:hypothetical protein C7271_01925 [filamentous cyanobacterium CCP5]|nr:hypothetical protein C7271_01925 [filamentous cyanobacterium CCP5]
MLNSDGHPHCLLPQNLALYRASHGRSPSIFGQERRLESLPARVLPLARQQVSFLEDLLGDG